MHLKTTMLLIALSYSMGCWAVGFTYSPSTGAVEALTESESDGPSLTNTPTDEAIHDYVAANCNADTTRFAWQASGGDVQDYSSISPGLHVKTASPDTFRIDINEGGTYVYSRYTESEFPNGTPLERRELTYGGTLASGAPSYIARMYCGN